MNKPPGSEKLAVPGPAGSLQAILETPADNTSRACAVICHPHPLHGGTMHNKIVHTLARAFVHSRIPALRFNFRGVESSEGSYDDGRGELQDALACVDFMRRRSPGLPLWLAGFSFGAAMAVKAAAAEPVDGLVAVAPAISRFAQGLDTQPSCPWLIVQGDEDELVDIEETVAWVDSLEPGPELLVIDGGEHFFHGRLGELRDAVIRFVQ